MKQVLCLLVVMGIFATVCTEMTSKRAMIPLNDSDIPSSLGRSKRNNKQRQRNQSGQPNTTSDRNLNGNGYGYDQLVLATEWSGSVCRVKKCNAGRPSNKNFFNLHGLWPNDAADFHNSPTDCDKSQVSLTKLTKETQNILNFYWNPLYSSAEQFLTHEWTKHGSCWKAQPENMNSCPSEIKKLVGDAANTSKADTVQRQTDYFATTIALAQKNNVFNALAAAGILPSNSRKYTKDMIEKALFSYFKINSFSLKCAKSSSGDSMLMEVRLCMDLNYQVTSCRRHSIECANQIMYPEYM